jgi:DNA-binding PadR family transcriptional regulator
MRTAAGMEGRQPGNHVQQFDGHLARLAQQRDALPGRNVKAGRARDPQLGSGRWYTTIRWPALHHAAIVPHARAAQIVDQVPKSPSTRACDGSYGLSQVNRLRIALRYGRQVAFQHVILALLEGGPSHGWQMKVRIEAALGPEYGGLNKGYIYEVIHKMEREQLITSRVQPQEGMRPDRSVLEITDAGRGQLTDWLGEPVRRSAGFRDEFVQKVLAASLRGEDAVREVCRTQRRSLLDESKTLQVLRRERATDPGAAFTIEVAILRTNAELECVEAAESRAAQRLIELPAHDQEATAEEIQPQPQRRLKGA